MDSQAAAATTATAVSSAEILAGRTRASHGALMDALDEISTGEWLSVRTAEQVMTMMRTTVNHNK